jgi:23S rRNA (guanosine2251-2'-O)-methyltransferase
VNARLRRNAKSIRVVHLLPGRDDARARDFVARVQAAGVPIETGDGASLDQLAGTDRHQGVVALVDPVALPTSLDEVIQGLAEPAMLLVLEGVTDPHNLGACLRSADAFGAHAVIVPKDRAVGVNATVAKAASGAAETVPVLTVTNLARALDDLKDSGIWILGADAGGEALPGADVSGPVAWVLGAEGAGLRRLTRERCDRIVGIPLRGSVESLNVAVACGICLYATRAAREPGRR